MKEKKRRKVWIPLVIAAIIIVAAFAAYQSDFVGRLRYPLEYQKDIQASADKYDIDPYLVAATIETESGFDPEAVSQVGAKGLMQIMPETGAWIAEKMGKTDYTDAMLLDPSTNIEIGCWYLRFLHDRFDTPDLVAAAYNAGHGRVMSWLEDASVSEDGENLTNIPFEETKNYVGRIEDAIQKYRKYYPDAFDV